MPAKIARLATRPPFWIPEVSVAVRSSRPSCSKAEKREYSWQIGSHPGNPGLCLSADFDSGRRGGADTKCSTLTTRATSFPQEIQGSSSNDTDIRYTLLA